MKKKSNTENGQWISDKGETKTNPDRLKLFFLRSESTSGLEAELS